MVDRVHPLHAGDEIKRQSPSLPNLPSINANVTYPYISKIHKISIKIPAPPVWTKQRELQEAHIYYVQTYYEYLNSQKPIKVPQLSIPKNGKFKVKRKSPSKQRQSPPPPPEHAQKEAIVHSETKEEKHSQESSPSPADAELIELRTNLATLHFKKAEAESGYALLLARQNEMMKQLSELQRTIDILQNKQALQLPQQPVITVKEPKTKRKRNTKSKKIRCQPSISNTPEVRIDDQAEVVPAQDADETPPPQTEPLEPIKPRGGPLPD